MPRCRVDLTDFHCIYIAELQEFLRADRAQVPFLDLLPGWRKLRAKVTYFHEWKRRTFPVLIATISGVGSVELPLR